MNLSDKIDEIQARYDAEIDSNLNDDIALKLAFRKGLLDAYEAGYKKASRIGRMIFEEIEIKGVGHD